MQYREFGNKGFKVSEIGHGLWGAVDWSGGDEKESLEAMELSLDFPYFLTIT